MRKLTKKLAVFGLFVGVLFIALQAFNPPPDKYGFGKRQAVELAYAATIDVSPNNLTLTYATLSLTGDCTLNVDVSNSVVGDRIVLDLTADASIRTVTFGTGMKGIAQAVAANKNELFEFIFNGTEFKGVAEMAVD